MNIIQKNLTKHTMYTLVHKTMGTVFTTQIIANERLSECEEKKVIKHQRLLENYLEQVDARFSTYLNDSEVSLFNRGEIKITEVSDVFIFVFSSCFAAKLATNEAFDANYNVKFDPSGFVKGWSIETGLNNFLKPLFKIEHIQAINLIGGGDMQFETRNGSNWVFDIGIVNPCSKKEIIKTLALTTGAIATSGISERGEHIYRRNKSVLQATVVGTSLQETDVWATALMVNPKASLPKNITGFVFYALEGDENVKNS